MGKDSGPPQISLYIYGERPCNILFAFGGMFVGFSSMSGIIAPRWEAIDFQQPSHLSEVATVPCHRLGLVQSPARYQRVQAMRRQYNDSIKCILQSNQMADDRKSYTPDFPSKIQENTTGKVGTS